MRQHRSERERHEHVAEGAPPDPNSVPADREDERSHCAKCQVRGTNAERRDHAARTQNPATTPTAGPKPIPARIRPVAPATKISVIADAPLRMAPRVANKRPAGRNLRPADGRARRLWVIMLSVPRRPTRIRTRRRLAFLPPALRPIWPYAKRTYTVAVGLVAPLSRALSRTSGGQLPRRTAGSAEDVVAREDGQMTIARDEERLVRSPPIGIPSGHPTLAAQADEIVPRVPLVELPGGRVLGPHRAVITARGTLIAELSPYFGIRKADQHPVFLDLLAPAPTFIAGRVGVLAARGDASYYHYLTDVLPRLALLEQGPPVQWFYLPASQPFQRELIELLAIPGTRVIDSDRARHLQAEMLVVPGLPDVDLKTPPWVVRFLRDRLLPPTAERVPGTRIYVTRGNRRGGRIVINETEVVAALGELGFRLVDPGRMTVAEQITTFAAAEWIVAPHGAALTNLAFASSGASVVELFAPDYVQGCYWKLSECVPGLTYRFLVAGGRTAAARSDGRGRQRHGRRRRCASWSARGPSCRRGAGFCRSGAGDDQVMSREGLDRA